jgi:hypothetical protein
VLAGFSRHNRERQYFLPGYQMKGRPLTRDEEHRIAAQTVGRRAGIRRSATKHGFMILNPLQEFTALFVLGMLGGIAAVFIALFVL